MSFIAVEQNQDWNSRALLTIKKNHTIFRFLDKIKKIFVYGTAHSNDLVYVPYTQLNNEFPHNKYWFFCSQYFTFTFNSKKKNL